MKKLSNTISVKELRSNLQDYVEAVDKGRSFTVIRRSKPVFKLMPIEEDRWETVVDFTRINRGGVDIDDVLTRL